VIGAFLHIATPGQVVSKAQLATVAAIVSSAIAAKERPASVMDS
jgi:hypothetical protein